MIGGERHYDVRPSVVHSPPGNTLTPVISCCNISVFSGGISCHKYLSCEWALLKRFSRSEIKGPGDSEMKRTFPTEGYPSAVRLLSELWRHTFRQCGVEVPSFLLFFRFYRAACNADAV